MNSSFNYDENGIIFFIVCPNLLHLKTSLFQHYANFNSEKGRLEMYLKVLENFETNIGGEKIGFRKNELIHTENSYKFTIDGFSHIAEQAGFKVKKVWTDDEKYYSVFVIVK